MTEQDLRALVREAIALQGSRAATTAAESRDAAGLRQHPSHGLLPVAAGADTDGPCVIEPAVPCNHCGYCKSYGH